jgi:ankyrin repeat protein
MEKADVNKANHDGRTPLYIACSHGHLEMARLLVEKADVNKANNDGQTPLYRACENGYLEVARLLMEKDAKVTPLILKAFIEYHQWGMIDGINNELNKNGALTRIVDLHIRDDANIELLQAILWPYALQDHVHMYMTGEGAGNQEIDLTFDPLYVPGDLK